VSTAIWEGYDRYSGLRSVVIGTTIFAFFIKKEKIGKMDNLGQSGLPNPSEYEHACEIAYQPRE